MGSVTLLLIMSVMMAIIQIAIFRTLPRSIRYVLAALPILGIIANFALSSMILVFTATGMFAGVSNLVGSVVFGVYLVAYQSKHQIEMKTKKILGFIPMFKIEARYPEESWFI